MRCIEIRTFPGTFPHRPVAGSFPEPSLRTLLLQGGGVYIRGSSTVKFERCGIYSNSAEDVGSTYLNRFPELSSIAPLREVSMNLTRISHVWQNVRLQQDLNRFPELSSIAPLKVVSWNYLAKFVSFGREVVFTFTVGLSPASAPKSTTIKRPL